MFELKMPQWGMEMTEGTILKWYKGEGERVEKGEALCEIEMAKSVGTFDSPVSGVINKLIAQVEDTVPVQGVMALIDTGG